MDPVRAEVYGTKGLAKLHRSRHFPDTAGMAALAAELYEDVHGRLVDAAVDTALDRLLVLEFNEFKRREGEWATSILETLMDTEIHQYPNCYTIAQNYIEAAKSDPLKAIKTSGITRLLNAFSDSQAQSRKTRAGSSLEHHIERLLKAHGIREFETQKKLTADKKTVKVDFIFPSILHFSIEPMDCVACACQTTSNDRFRLSIPQLDKGLRKYILTAIGCTNFGAALQGDSLSKDKLREVEASGIRYVILEKGMDERLRRHPAVITYQEFFQELTRLTPIWR